MIKLISALSLSVALGATPASAMDIAYTVYQTIGLGSVTGTITTDGALGTLGAADVTAFNLTVTGLGASVVLTDADSVIVATGSNFSATATNLLFDYSGPSGFLVFQQGSFGTGAKYYCNASTFDACFQGASAVPQYYSDSSAQFEARTGSEIIASVAGAVPEPATWALMIGGFGLVGTAARRRPVALAA